MSEGHVCPSWTGTAAQVRVSRGVCCHALPEIIYATDPARLSPETPGFEGTWYAQGSPGEGAVKERGRQQSLSAAAPQQGREDRPLTSPPTRLRLTLLFLPPPGSKPLRQVLNDASFQQLGPRRVRFIISQLSYLPVQLTRVRLSVAAFSQAGLDCHHWVRACSS